MSIDTNLRLAAAAIRSMFARGGNPLNSAGCVVVQFFGDSTLGSTHPLGAAGVLALLLRGAFPGQTRIVNSAVSGTDSRFAIGPIDDHPEYGHIAAVIGDVVVVNWGINDAGRNVPLELYRDNLRAFAPGARRLVFQTPGPVAPPAASTANYAQVMREVAAERNAPVIDVQKYQLGMPRWESLTLDGTHPGLRLYAELTTKVAFPVVRVLVEAALREERWPAAAAGIPPVRR